MSLPVDMLWFNERGLPVDILMVHLDGHSTLQKPSFILIPLLRQNPDYINIFLFLRGYSLEASHKTSTSERQIKGDINVIFFNFST